PGLEAGRRVRFRFGRGPGQHKPNSKASRIAQLEHEIAVLSPAASVTAEDAHGPDVYARVQGLRGALQGEALASKQVELAALLAQPAPLVRSGPPKAALIGGATAGLFAIALLATVMGGVVHFGGSSIAALPTPILVAVAAAVSSPTLTPVLQP